jgi:hypothetical protein
MAIVVQITVIGDDKSASLVTAYRRFGRRSINLYLTAQYHVTEGCNFYRRIRNTTCLLSVPRLMIRQTCIFACRLHMRSLLSCKVNQLCTPYCCFHL